MADLRIVDAPLLSTVKGTEKLPTGGEGNFSVSVNQVADFAKLKWFLATEEYVDNAVGNIQADLNLHKNNVSNPHQVTKEQVGLGNVDNTADLDKPVSNATQSAIITANSGKADKSYVDSQDQLKADKNTVEASLLLKADKVDLKASKIASDGGQTQQVINDFGGAKWYAKSGGYELGATVKLENGDTVKSTVANNIINPNVDMTGWQLADAALNAQKLKRENVSVWDFFTASEFIDYKAFPATFDAARPLQAFFDYISANNVGCAYADGEIWVKSAITFGGVSGSLTKHVKGYLKITAINTSLTATPPIETLFTFQPGSNLRWEGVIHVVGSTINSLNYDRRHVRNGILIGGQYSATHAVIDFIHAENGFKEFGIVVGNLTTGLSIEKIRGNRSGSGYEGSGYVPSLYSNFTKVSDTTGTGTQRTTISVENFPDYTSQIGYVVISGQIYLITTKDAVAKTLEIFPILPSGVVSGNAKYVFGGVYYTTGGDASVTSVGNMNCSTSAISAQLSALYPPTIGSITSQNNFCALSLGSSISAGLVGGTIDELYCEALEYDIIQNTRFNINLSIANNVAIELDKCLHVGNYRLPDNSLDRTYLLGVAIGYESTVLQPQDFRTAGTIIVPVFSANTAPVVSPVFASNKVVNLTEGKKSLHRLYGYSNRVIKFANATGNVTQSITFNPPAGYTLNNQSSPLVFSNIGGAPVFEVIYHGGVNVTVNLVGRSVLPTVSVAYDPPSIAAGATETTTVSLTGATLGAVVQAAFSQYNAGIEITSVVSATNTVTVKFKNTSAAAVDLASGTLTVKLI